MFGAVAIASVFVFFGAARGFCAVCVCVFVCRALEASATALIHWCTDTYTDPSRGGRRAPRVCSKKASLYFAISLAADSARTRAHAGMHTLFLFSRRRYTAWVSCAWRYGMFEFFFPFFL